MLVASVSAAEIERLDERMSLHHQAVIEALQENRDRLDVSRRRLDDMLGKAYVLEDGRRVFKTEDGQRVFDEHGNELGADEIDPDAIDAWRPRWEAYAEERDRHHALETERDALLDYQDKLDQAQARIDGGTLSEDDFADIEALLAESAPAAVRQKLPASEPAAMSEPLSASSQYSAGSAGYESDFGLGQ